MPHPDSDESRKRVLDAVFAEAQRGGGPPREKQFEATNWEDSPALHALLSDGTLYVDSNWLKWGTQALGLRVWENQFAELEMWRARVLLEKLRAHYRGDVEARWSTQNLLAALGGHPPGEFRTLPDVGRALGVLSRLGVLEHMSSGSEFYPHNFMVSRSILLIDGDATFVPRAFERRAHMVETRLIPTEAIDGRWIPDSKRRPMRGGNGIVTVVTDFTGALKGQLALKTLHADAISEKNLIRFRQEVEVLETLEHPNVLKVLASSLDGDAKYYVADLCKHDLAQHLGNNSLTSIEKLALFAAVCDGVQAAHDRKIVHRDLKPSNILIDRRNTPRVADFGICFVPESERRTATEEAVGAQKYIAPELRHGRLDEAKITTRADVYALGKILYRMFAPDEQLFEREEFMEPEFEITKRTGCEELAHLNRLFERTIQKDPARRLLNAGEVAEEVRKLIPLIKGNYIIVDGGGNQRCIACGVGRYERENGTFEKANLVEGFPVRALACNECGHVLMFRPTTDAARKRWGIT